MKSSLKTDCALAAILIAVGSLTGVAYGATVVSPVGLRPVSVTTTSSFGGSFPETKTIDSAAYTTGVTDWATVQALPYIGEAALGSGDHYTALNATTGTITFDMGGSFLMDRARFDWTNGGTSNNYADFTLLISDSASFVTSDLAYTNVGAPAATFEVVSFTDGYVGRYVRLNWTSIQGSYGGMTEIIIGGEVAAAVPEPTSAFLLGLGALGLLTRRGRAK